MAVSCGGRMVAHHTRVRAIRNGTRDGSRIANISNSFEPRRTHPDALDKCGEDKMGEGKCGAGMQIAAAPCYTGSAPARWAGWILNATYLTVRFKSAQPLPGAQKVRVQARLRAVGRGLPVVFPSHARRQ